MNGDHENEVYKWLKGHKSGLLGMQRECFSVFFFFPRFWCVDKGFLGWVAQVMKG